MIVLSENIDLSCSVPPEWSHRSSGVEKLKYPLNQYILWRRCVMVAQNTELIPQALEKVIKQIAERVSQLKRQYKSLANYGRPYIEDIKEIATIYYLNEKLNIGLNVLADMIGVDKTSLYKTVQKIKEKNEVVITNPKTKKIETIAISPAELINIVEADILNVTSRQRIVDPMQSSIIKEFWEKDIERMTQKPGFPTYYSEREKLQTIREVEKIMQYLANKGEVSNPDYWTKELLVKTLEELYPDARERRIKIKILRRIPHFRSWLEGKVGAEKHHIVPKTSCIYYEDFLKLKELYRKGELKEEEILVIWLHVTTGAREGWSTLELKYKDIYSVDIEDARSSLVGLKWESFEAPILKVYESKTNKVWTTDLRWLDEELYQVFLKYRRDKGSIVKTLTGIKTVGEFRDWYSDLLKKVSKLLKLNFVLKPHDMRRSHISILAELGVPLEYSLSGNLDFGVGWEDVSTALIYYLRFSRYTKIKLFEMMQSRKAEISSISK
jgi:hypothetical protein